ncbi:MAG: hypothetical protein KJ072_22355 [Verrucomicrobia bacterium]|nr:hypothetical protein [Verrucomicrobiota bacterium]
MTSQEAQDYIRRYLEVLGEGDKRGGRRNPSQLPASKENILTAIKLEIAQLYFINSATEELVCPLVHAAMFIDSFTHEALDTQAFVRNMRERQHEIQGFHKELMNIERTDSFYWQRVYALIGVGLETKSQTFFDQLKSRLGLGAKPASNAGQTTIFRHFEDRIVLD